MELLHEKEFAPESIEGKVVAVIKTCYDPEIPVDIFSMGLIYEVEVSDTKDVQVTMTLTSPACPVAGTLPPEVEHKIKAQVEEINLEKGKVRALISMFGRETPVELDYIQVE